MADEIEVKGLTDEQMEYYLRRDKAIIPPRIDDKPLNLSELI